MEYAIEFLSYKKELFKKNSRYDEDPILLENHLLISIRD